MPTIAVVRLEPCSGKSQVETSWSHSPLDREVFSWLVPWLVKTPWMLYLAKVSVVAGLHCSTAATRST
jgi:hypothetical protein